LGAPDHRWNVDTHGGSIELDFSPVATIVHCQMTGPPDTKQELMEGFVCMFTTNLSIRHIKY
jgi:hypothetical protein